MNADLWIAYQGDGSFNSFGKAMGRDIRGHPHRNSRRSVDEKIWKFRGKDEGFPEGFIIIWNKFYGILIDICQQFRGEFGHSHLGISHGGRGIPIDGTEVPLTIHQGVP